MDGIITYEVLCDWLLPLIISLSEFILVVACTSASFLFTVW